MSDEPLQDLLAQTEQTQDMLGKLEKINEALNNLGGIEAAIKAIRTTEALLVMAMGRVIPQADVMKVIDIYNSLKPNAESIMKQLADHREEKKAQPPVEPPAAPAT